jgi:hypothetical protein
MRQPGCDDGNALPSASTRPASASRLTTGRNWLAKLRHFFTDDA